MPTQPPACPPKPACPPPQTGHPARTPHPNAPTARPNAQVGSKLTTSVDTFSFGIMMWELYTGQRAYGGLGRDAIIDRCAPPPPPPPAGSAAPRAGPLPLHAPPLSSSTWVPCRCTVRSARCAENSRLCSPAITHISASCCSAARMMPCGRPLREAGAAVWPLASHLRAPVLAVGRKPPPASAPSPL